MIDRTAPRLPMPGARACRAMVLAACALIATPGVAQPAATPAPAIVNARPDAATIAAARRLIKASDITSQMRAIGPQMIDTAMKRANSRFKAGQMPPELARRLEMVMRTHMGGMIDVFSPEIQETMAQVYARHFSRADLERVAGIMEDPVMTRFRAGSPAVMRELMPVLMTAMEPRQRAFEQALMRTIAEWISQNPTDADKLAKPTT